MVIFVWIVLGGLLLLAAKWLASSGRAGNLLQKYRQQFDEQKSKVTFETLRTKVAGVRYPNEDTGVARQKIIQKVKPGEPLVLFPDERNKFDRAAVKVCRANGEQLGFLDMDLAVEIYARLKDGARVDARVIFIHQEDTHKEVEIELQKYSRRPVEK